MNIADQLNTLQDCREIFFFWWHQMYGVFTNNHQLSDPWTPTGCLAIQFDFGTKYPELWSDPKV